MKASVALLCLFAVAGIVTKVACLTNGEFYELAKEYGEDFEEEDIPDSAVEDDDSNAINLRGGMDDEIDIVDLVAQLKMQADTEEKPTAKAGKSVSWWRRRRRRRRRRRPSRKICNCRRFDCKCCVGKTYSVNLWIKRIRFKFHACVEFKYLPRNHGFELTVTFNGRRMYHKEISLRHPPKLCYGVPGLRRFASVCLELYNVNFARKSLCARLVGVLDLKVYKFRVHLNLSCFRIPIAEDDLNKLLSDTDNWKFETLAIGEESASRDLLEDESRELGEELNPDDENDDTLRFLP